MAGGRDDVQSLMLYKRWLRLLIFQAMGCPLIQKVTLAAFMLSRKADIWQGALQRMMTAGTKFVSGLRPEIKQVFNYQGITQYHDLVNKCRVYDEDNRARVTHYMSGGPMRNHNKFGSSSKDKPYTKSIGDSSSIVNNQGSLQQRSQAPMTSQTSKGGSVGSIPHNNYFKCGEPGHRAYEFQASKVIICFNCQEKGHKACECPKNKKGTTEVGGSTSKPRAREGCLP
ncbi:uncharacterized protein LOC109790972 [Cajanus cajan]|uniref:uncharacterized protein LOC109790972 n=1 Tax=Cajanus cajan TaxID=3821 RepID=UPI00098DC3B0|nr:uncharacterized protein LOC109790972 [Cajanus cajan]